MVHFFFPSARKICPIKQRSSELHEELKQSLPLEFTHTEIHPKGLSNNPTIWTASIECRMVGPGGPHKGMKSFGEAHVGAIIIDVFSS